MAMSRCYGLIKYILVIVNLIFWATGLTGIVLAVWMLTDQRFLISLAQEQNNFNAGIYILLAGSSLMLIVAFLGCCGAFRESQGMLLGFLSCLLVVIVAQIAAAAWLYTNSDRLEQLLRQSVINTVKHEYGVIDSRTQIVDAYQSGLGCCGATGPSDWAGSRYVRKDPSLPLSLTVTSDSNVNYRIPDSCCKERGTAACRVAVHTKIAGYVDPAIYNQGCTDKLLEALKNQSTIFLGVAIGVGILELLGVMFSLIMCCAIGSSDRYKA